MKTDKKIEEIIKHIISLCDNSISLGFPTSSNEHKAYIRQTLLEYRDEVRREVAKNEGWIEFSSVSDIRKETLKAVLPDYDDWRSKKCCSNDCVAKSNPRDLTAKTRNQVRDEIISTAKEKYNIELE